MPRLVVHDRAKTDLDDIADYSIDAALRFYQAAQEAFNRLADFPGSGAQYPTGNPAYASLRIWPITGFRKFLVCYLPIPNGVEILRVIHGARDVNRIFK